MLKTHLTYLTLVLPLLFSCGNKIIRQEIPEESIRVDVFDGNRAVSRNLLCEVSIRHMDKSELSKLLAADKLPKLLFFQVLIKNTGSFPLFLTESSVTYGSHSLYPFTPEDMGIKKLKALMRPQRIVQPDFYFGNSFPEDFIQYKLDFIAPEDTIAFIMAFEYPPPRVRKYSLLFRLKAGSRNSTIGFTLKRAEFRSKGKDFRPKPNITEDFF